MGNTTQQRKRELRQEMKVVLANLDRRWAARANAEVCHQLSELVLSLKREAAVEHVLAWVPYFPGEIDLGMFVGEMLKSTAVYLPRVDGPGVMSFVRVSDDWASHLVPGHRGVLQPRDGYGEAFQAVGSSGVVVITPGIAFDRSGRRLGRGGGYYDRFLSSCNDMNAIRIGVCWSIQVVPEVPVDHHDMKVDWVCHERGALRVGGEST